MGKAKAIDDVIELQDDNAVTRSSVYRHGASYESAGRNIATRETGRTGLFQGS